jgi:hypothetical protein
MLFDDVGWGRTAGGGEGISSVLDTAGGAKTLACHSSREPPLFGRVGDSRVEIITLCSSDKVRDNVHACAVTRRKSARIGDQRVFPLLILSAFHPKHIISLRLNRSTS